MSCVCTSQQTVEQLQRQKNCSKDLISGKVKGVIESTTIQKVVHVLSHTPMLNFDLDHTQKQASKAAIFTSQRALKMLIPQYESCMGFALLDS